MEQRFEQQVSGKIYGENQKGQAEDDVDRTRAPGAVKESVTESEIQVFRGVRETRDQEKDNCSGGLQRPGAAVVSESMQGPEKKRGHREVKQ